MRRHQIIAASLLLILIVVTSGVVATTAQDAQPQATEEVQVQPIASPTVRPPATGVTPIPPTASSAPGNEIIYVVQPGDNLFRIAIRFNTTVRTLAQLNGIVNPSLIYVGQRLRIPVTGPAVTPTAPPVPTAGATGAPTPTTTPSATTTYVVQPGDTLIRLAIRFNTTVSRLVALNNLANPNLIFVGQRLIVPAGGSGQGGSVAATPEVLPPAPAGVTQSFGFDYGIEANLVGQESELAAEITRLGVRWVKQEISWRDLEPVEGEIDFATLDSIVGALEAQNLRILFTVTNAPDWARTGAEEDGPPDDFADFGRFVGALAQRFAGRVQAYEIWSEPNLRREWNSPSHPISPTGYLDLLRQGYNAVKAADPTAIVISAGLAPTGFNDGVNAINDRLYLRALYAAGLAGLSDAIGAHPGGWANPPDASCCAAPSGVTTHYEDRSFYFLDTLNDYRQIMVQNNDSNTAIWVTKFGWGTSEDTDPPSQTYIFVTYTSLQEQATFIPRGFELGADLGFVGPMFLNNLNGCLPGDNFSSEACYFSLLGPNGAPRPAFNAVQAIDKSGGAAAPATTPTATPIFAPTFTPAAGIEAPTGLPTSQVEPPAIPTPTDAGSLPVEPTEEKGGLAPVVPTSEPASTPEAAP